MKTKIYFGTMGRKDPEAFADIYETMIKGGVFGLDTAWVYGNSKEIGEALKILDTRGYKDIKIQTKIHFNEFHIVRDNLKVMMDDYGVEKIHSLLLHRPAYVWDDTVKAWEELIKLKEEGIVDHIGVSNMDKDHIQMLTIATGVQPEVNQVEMSVTNFREDRLAFCKDSNIEIQAYAPLGRNLKENGQLDFVKEMCIRYDIQPSQLFLSYLATQDIVPISGAANPEQAALNMKTMLLTPKDIGTLKQLNTYNNRFKEAYD